MNRYIRLLCYLYIVFNTTLVNARPTHHLISRFIDLVPTVDAGEARVTVYLPDNTLTIQATASNYTSVQWRQASGPSTATVNGTNQLRLEIAELKAGSYVFVVTVTDAQGMQASDQIQVDVIASAPGTFVLVPKKFFSPNNDGNNDTWDIRNISERPGYTVIILDTKGKKLLEKTGFTSDVVWDGAAAGYGAYYYIIRDENQQEVRTGTFSLFL